MSWKDELSEGMRADAEAMFGDLPADQQPGDDDPLEVGLGPTGAVLTIDNLTTMDKFVNLGSETARLRPQAGGALLELSVWRAGKMVHLEKRRRRAGKRPRAND